jgi:hypothetical protein
VLTDHIPAAHTGKADLPGRVRTARGAPRPDSAAHPATPRLAPQLRPSASAVPEGASAYRGGGPRRSRCRSRAAAPAAACAPVPAAGSRPGLVLGATSKGNLSAAAAPAAPPARAAGRWFRAATAHAAATQAATFAAAARGAGEIDHQVGLLQQRRQRRADRHARRRAPACSAASSTQGGAALGGDRAPPAAAPESSAAAAATACPCGRWRRRARCGWRGRRPRRSHVEAAAREESASRPPGNSSGAARACCHRAERLIQLAQQRALLARQIHRRLDHHAAEQIAARCRAPTSHPSRATGTRARIGSRPES